MTADNAFGSYEATFFHYAQSLWKHLLISLILFFLTGLNILGSESNIYKVFQPYCNRYHWMDFNTHSGTYFYKGINKI